MSDARRTELYPRFCFHLAPTVKAWCLLRASDIHRLRQHSGFEGENFFFYENLPVKWVRLVGVIVAIDDYSGRRVYTVDDSSGACIQVLTSTQTTASAAQQPAGGPVVGRREGNAAAEKTLAGAGPTSVAPDLGAVVDVKGGLSTFRSEVQIMAERIVILKSTAQEIALWERRARFRHEVLEKPWVLSPKDIRRCRREAHRCEDADGLRKKRKASKSTGRALSSKKPDDIVVPKEGTTGRDKSGTLGPKAGEVMELIRSGAVRDQYDALGL